MIRTTQRLTELHRATLRTRHTHSGPASGGVELTPGELAALLDDAAELDAAKADLLDARAALEELNDACRKGIAEYEPPESVQRALGLNGHGE